MVSFFAQLGVDVNNGLGDVYAKIATLPQAQKEEIEAAIAAVYENQPALAMVDSDRGITNLHVPSDVIVDASMPAMLRASGQMWGPDGKQKDTKAMIQTVVMLVFTKRSLISVKSMARLIQRLWVVCRT